MALKNAHGKETTLVLSSDAKPRLKWTRELHQIFIDAVNHLGGAEKATPKSLMRIMSIDGLTLYHLKSHLQKYRLGKSQLSHTCHQNKSEENEKNQLTNKTCDGAHEQINESLQVTHSLQMQMEVQKKLHEQIEVQRHLQLRIEAQGKYLQSVLRKAQETISEYSSCSIEVEHAKAQLSQLASMVDSTCPSSSFSVLTDSGGSLLKDEGDKLLGHNGYSLESSLTSSDSSAMKEETQTTQELGKSYITINKGKRNSAMLSLMEMNPAKNSESENQARNVKRSKSTTADEINHREKFNCDKQVQRFNLNDFDSGPKVIDLNRNGLDLFGASFSI
ncbi:hypothetical protein ABFS83_12G100900 [Erythranthe nasuta]